MLLHHTARQPAILQATPHTAQLIAEAFTFHTAGHSAPPQMASSSDLRGGVLHIDPVLGLRIHELAIYQQLDGGLSGGGGQAAVSRHANGGGCKQRRRYARQRQSQRRRNGGSAACTGRSGRTVASDAKVREPTTRPREAQRFRSAAGNMVLVAWWPCGSAAAI